MTRPSDLTAIEARARIGRRQLSPVELLDDCIARVEEIDHAVNAMPARDFDRACGLAKQAEAAVMRGEALGALHGLPVGIKDLEATEGLRTTWGSPIFADHVPTKDEGTVASLKAAGAIVMGKTNVPEFGLGANSRNTVYGATGNAFDPTKNAAGSSGGSAVALACNMAPICSGSDMGGSLRNPAAFNGIVGFRPTPGLVPNETRGLGWSGLGVLGPMARTVRDVGLMLSVMALDNRHDPLSTWIHGETVRSPLTFHPTRTQDLTSLRVAITEDFGFTPTESIVRAAFREKVGLFRHAFGAAEDTHPDCEGANEAFEILRSTNVLAAHYDKVTNRPQDCGPNMIANVQEGLRYTARDVAHANVLQTNLYRRFQSFFDNHDLIISPAITTSPRDWHELYPAEIDGKPTRTYFHWLSLAYVVTLCGHPAISLPVGLDSKGMPFGLQIVGPRGGDALVLRTAAALEDMLAADPRTARPVPDLAALAKAAPIAAMPGFREWT